MPFSAQAQPALQWATCPWGQTTSGTACTGTPTPLTWQQALQAAQTANAALHAGYADWRVPNRTELESTVDLAAPVNAAMGTFWSSTSQHSTSAKAWTVDFASGASHSDNKTALLALRLVRGGTAEQTFQSSGPVTTPALPLPSQPGQTAQATVTGGGTGCGFTHAQFVAASSAPPPPAHIKLAADLFEFILDGCTPGGSVQITITYPQALAEVTQFWKHGPTASQGNHWYAYPDARISSSTVTLKLTDGALGDDDLDATNGRIVDAGAPAQVLALGEANAIPTLSWWGLLLVSAVLWLAALRRRAYCTSISN